MHEKLKIYEEKMTKTLANLDGELAAIRAGSGLLRNTYAYPAGSQRICSGGPDDPDPALGEKHAEGD